MGREKITLVCPFYVQEPVCANMTTQTKKAHMELVSKRIRCEGLSYGGKLFVEFKTPEEKEEHENDFCCSHCYKGCPVAQMLLEQYDTKGKKKYITSKGRC